MKQVLLTFAVFAFSFSVSAEETSQTPPAKATVTTKPKGTITPAVEPRVLDGLGVCIDADFTWWKSQLSGMDFATIDSHVRSPSSHFQPGFKVGCGLDLDFDGWDAYIEYTWFNNPWSSSVHRSTNKTSYSSFVFVDPYSGALSSMILEHVKSSRKEQFNIVDAELARNFFISKRLTLRPHFGFKAARMLEKTDLFQYQDNGPGSITEHLSQTLSGFGIRAGVDTLWHLFRSFGLYGDLAVSALWSSIHNNNTTRYSSDGSITTTPSISEKTQTILPVIEMGVGVSYMAWLYNERYQLYAKAGWEEQIWINYNYNMPNGTTNNTGNLTLQGLTVKAGFVF